MSNYTKLTSYDTKDALSTGDPLKRVKGTELDDEFDAISTAIATKADTTSPSFSGTPTVPTATSGTNTTQAASTSFVQTAIAAAKEALYPVGTIYTNISVSTNPATLFGFGTWVAIAGRVVVGLDAADAAFDTAGETGGSKDAIVVSHTHTATDSGHNHALYYTGAYGTENNSANMLYQGYGYNNYVQSTEPNAGITGSGAANISVSTTGSSATNANLQPYVVAYVWKRTA